MKARSSTKPNLSLISSSESRDKSVALYIRAYENGKIIRTSELEDFGYRFTARYIVVTPLYKLFELLPIDSSRPANACFMTEDPKLGGVIVSYPFQEHKARLQTWRP